MKTKKISCNRLDRTMFYMDDDVSFAMLDSTDLGYLRDAAAMRLPAKDLYISAADRKKIVRAKAMLKKSYAIAQEAAKMLTTVYNDVEKQTNRLNAQLEAEDDSYPGM